MGVVHGVDPYHADPVTTTLRCSNRRSPLAYPT